VVFCSPLPKGSLKRRPPSGREVFGVLPGGQKPKAENQLPRTQPPLLRGGPTAKNKIKPTQNLFKFCALPRGASGTLRAFRGKGFCP